MQQLIFLTFNENENKDGRSCKVCQILEDTVPLLTAAID